MVFLQSPPHSDSPADRLSRYGLVSLAAGQLTFVPCRRRRRRPDSLTQDEAWALPRLIVVKSKELFEAMAAEQGRSSAAGP